MLDYFIFNSLFFVVNLKEKQARSYRNNTGQHTPTPTQQVAGGHAYGGGAHAVRCLLFAGVQWRRSAGQCDATVR